MGYNNLRGATRVGGRPGARPRLAPERGPLRIKKRMANISFTGIRKPIELL